MESDYGFTNPHGGAIPPDANYNVDPYSDPTSNSYTSFPSQPGSLNNNQIFYSV